MLKTLRNAFKIKDVRNRILFTFMMLIVIRIGSELPIPGVKGSVFQSWLNSKSADGLGFVDAITGGSFSQMSVFALNITPYITSSIIMQLLTIAIPKLCLLYTSWHRNDCHGGFHAQQTSHSHPQAI